MWVHSGELREAMTVKECARTFSHWKTYTSKNCLPSGVWGFFDPSQCLIFSFSAHPHQCDLTTEIKKTNAVVNRTFIINFMPSYLHFFWSVSTKQKLAQSLEVTLSAEVDYTASLFFMLCCLHVIWSIWLGHRPLRVKEV